MLPKLETPTYNIKLPTGKDVKFRPFLVKERSILLLALEEGKSEGIIDAIRSIIKACTFDQCILDKMPIIDAEYLFLNVRNKSVGETLEVIHTCECGKGNELIIDTEHPKVEGDLSKADIQLDNTTWVKMKFPSFGDSSFITEDPTEEEVLKMISSCIDSIIQGNSVYKASDASEEELEEFILSLTQQQLNKIEEFFLELPKIVIRHSYDCKCGKHNEVVLEGLENFFE